MKIGIYKNKTIMKKIYIIWIGWIGISALARYYNTLWYQVYGSDLAGSPLIEDLKKEGMNIIIGEDEERIQSDFELVIYSEAVQKNQRERKKAESLGLHCISYPQALGFVTDDKKLIAIAWTHGKSTTTSLVSLILKNSNKDFSSIVGTIVKEFDEKNFFVRQTWKDDKYFVLESCEYKEAFLNYKPFIWVITNIEADHLDYYKNIDNYVLAFQKFIQNIRPQGFALINMNNNFCKSLLSLRDDIHFVEVYENYFIIKWEKYIFPQISMQIPWNHILFDAKLAYIVGKILDEEEKNIIKTLENYNWVWRRMEIIKKTKNGNILMSDYGHHPTEILLTTKAIKEKYTDKKLYCVFQPHQYSRTLELLNDFKMCFWACDFLVIPDIYASRDSEEDKKKIDGEKFAELIDSPKATFWNGIKNTLKIIETYDEKNPASSIILLLGAGNVDNLRYEIQ